MLDAQWIAVNGKAEKPSYRTSWPKCSKSITMCRPLDSQNSLLHGIALSEKWLKSHLPLPTQMVLGLLSTSLLNRWKGDEHTQGVSLSPRMVRNADIGYRSAKILADMSCSFNLQPNTGRVWFSTSEAHVVWAERISAVIFSFFWRLLKENFKTWTSTAKPRGHRMIQMTPTKNLGGREIWSSSHFGTNEVGRNKGKPMAMGVNGLFVKQEGKTGMLGILMMFSPNPNTESECHHFLSTCHIMSVRTPASHFATRQLGAKCFPMRNLASKWDSACLGFGWLNAAR